MENYQTFHDLLSSGKEMDCDLIIGGTEIPATFVWGEGDALTAHGTDFYEALLKSPYELLENGNVEVFCDDYELGEHFTLAAAGAISLSEHNKLFTRMELTRADIRIDRELIVYDDGISAYIETWFDVDEKFGIETADDNDVWVNFYALYHPENDCIRFTYIIVAPTGNIEYEYHHTPDEATLVKSMMEEVCQKESNCDLRGLWLEDCKDVEEDA